MSETGAAVGVIVAANRRARRTGEPVRPIAGAHVAQTCRERPHAEPH
jgi:hypothetical protein